MTSLSFEELPESARYAMTFIAGRINEMMKENRGKWDHYHSVLFDKGGWDALYATGTPWPDNHNRSKKFALNTWVLIIRTFGMMSEKIETDLFSYIYGSWFKDSYDIVS